MPGSATKGQRDEKEFGEAFDNPMSDEVPLEDRSSSVDGQAQQTFDNDAKADSKTADLDHDLTDDELSDLTFAFQAMDRDAPGAKGHGTIEPEELYAMMVVLGAEITREQVDVLFRETKEEFLDWMKKHEVGTTLPEFMDHTSDEAGHHGATKHGGKRHHTALAVDKNAKQHPVFSRLRRLGKNPAIAYTVGAPITASQKLLAISYGLAKDAVPKGLVGGEEDGECRAATSASPCSLSLNTVTEPSQKSLRRPRRCTSSS